MKPKWHLTAVNRVLALLIYPAIAASSPYWLLPLTRALSTSATWSLAGLKNWISTVIPFAINMLSPPPLSVPVDILLLCVEMRQVLDLVLGGRFPKVRPSLPQGLGIALSEGLCRTTVLCA